MVHRIESGESRQTEVGADVGRWHFTSLLTVLGRYTDRDPYHLSPVAHDPEALMDVIRNGESLIARCERQAEEAEKRESGK